MSEIINPVSERETTVKCWDIEWSVIVTLWEDGQWSIFAEGGTYWTGTYQYDPLWVGDHDPSDKEIFDTLDAQMQSDAEAAWEARYSPY